MRERSIPLCTAENCPGNILFKFYDTHVIFKLHVSIGNKKKNKTHNSMAEKILRYFATSNFFIIIPPVAISVNIFRTMKS